MKKSDFILIGVVILIIGFALISSKGNEKFDYPLTLAGEVGLHKVTYTEYEKMVKEIRTAEAVRIFWLLKELDVDGVPNICQSLKMLQKRKRFQFII